MPLNHHLATDERPSIYAEAPAKRRDSSTLSEFVQGLSLGLSVIALLAVVYWAAGFKTPDVNDLVTYLSTLHLR